MIELRGITWDHERGFDPVHATAQAYMVENPDIHITWNRRTLREFAELSVLDLAGRYDLIVLDHPWTGAAAAKGILLPLDEHLDAAFLADQAAHSVGQSYESYTFDGHVWALPIDAAAQVSAYRPDLLGTVPQTWIEARELAVRLKGRAAQVAIALMPVDTLPTFISLCANRGEPPMRAQGRLVSREIGRAALQDMRFFAENGHPESITWNPPQLLDRMAMSDEIAYCPLLFGYSNYARPGYRPHLVRFANIPRGADGRPSGAILGGAGLAVSAQTAHPSAACAYAAYTASPTIQRTIYFEHAGQPGHRSAWLDPAVNAAANGFFRDTLETLDCVYRRPRHDGYIAFQDAACDLLHHFLTSRGDPNRVLDQLEALYLDSLPSYSPTHRGQL